MDQWERTDRNHIFSPLRFTPASIYLCLVILSASLKLILRYSSGYDLKGYFRRVLAPENAVGIFMNQK